MIIVIVRDIVGNVWSNPEYQVSTGMAIRGFADMIANKRTDERGNMHPLAAHPEHYELYKAGDYDSQTGRFKILGEYEQLAVGANFK